MFANNMAWRKSSANLRCKPTDETEPCVERAKDACLNLQISVTKSGLPVFVDITDLVNLVERPDVNETTQNIQNRRCGAVLFLLTYLLFW